MPHRKISRRLGVRVSVSPSGRVPSQDVLDAVTFDSLTTDPAYITEISKFNAALQAAVAAQRAAVMSDIRAALGIASRPIAFEHWQRRVPVRHQDKPLSARGSVLSSTGGRFNIGSIDPSRFPSFPALYLGEKPITAHAEALGDPQPSDPVNIEDRVFASTTSYAMFSVSGEISECLDITDKNSLKDFIDCIRSFSLPPALSQWGAQLLKNWPGLVTSIDQMHRILLSSEWRKEPLLLDHPADNQTFGQIAESAGLEAIKYPSVRYPGTQCIAAFLRNFAHSNSWIQLDDETPAGTISRLDSTTYTDLV